ncbi:hypothetical protein [Pelagibius sp. Alg239-R121]|uniref:hypothetical protein n=1 Tax=Pelagibius sp. Alg239-R121 TaxID=2993448 RepID=UPI0024A71648|nr:hypothetical protein [Pelagibius sp. Alg239-R121]
MRNLILAISAVGLILIGATGAKAGEYHGGHQSHSYKSSPYWVGAYIFGGHHDRSHRAYDRRHDHRSAHKHRHGKHSHYDRHDRYDRHGHYKKHKHGHKFHKRRILPIKKIVKKLRRRDYYDISKIVLKRDRYKVRAYDYRGRPVKLVVNAHNGRILKKRYR